MSKKISYVYNIENMFMCVPVCILCCHCLKNIVVSKIKIFAQNLLFVIPCVTTRWQYQIKHYQIGPVCPRGSLFENDEDAILGGNKFRVQYEYLWKVKKRNWQVTKNQLRRTCKVIFKWDNHLLDQQKLQLFILSW